MAAATALRVQLLGGFRVLRDGELAPNSAWERPGARQLVKLLAVQPGHRMHREKVLEALWPDLAPDAGLNAFRKALYQARRALEPDRTRRGQSAYLQLAGEVLHLQACTDADEFEGAAGGALAAGAVDALDEALARYTGELLPEDQYEEWVSERREQLASLHRRLLLARARFLETAGLLDEAIARYQEIVRADPTQEEVHRAVMRLQLANGSRHGAIRQYQLCREALERELGVEPEEETEALYRDVLRAGTGRRRTVSEHTVSLPPALRRLPGTPLVGRERAARHLRDALARAREGAGRMVLVSGEAGVGKSRLIAEMAREASRNGRAMVLWGAGSGAESGVPYGPFVEALEGYLHGQPDVERVRTAQQYPEVARLLPSLIGEAGETHAGEVQRGELFAALVRLLIEAAGAKPLLLVLDDLHWADAASVELFQLLVRQLPERPWLIVGAYRREDVPSGSELARVLSWSNREGDASAIGLLRLAREDSDKLVQTQLGSDEVDEAVLERVYELALGNPLFACELLTSMRETGIIERHDGRWQLVDREATVPVPHGVRELVQSRVHELGEPAARALGAAAVAGMEVSFSVLQGGVEMRTGPLLDALDRALEAQVLEEREAGYAFRHPLFQAALYAGLSQHRRMHLHGLIAETIEREQPDAVDALAYHFDRGGSAERALEYLERAGDHARWVYANVLAEERYRDVIDRLDRLERPVDAARVREKLARVMMTVARFSEALELLQEALPVQLAAGTWERAGWLAVRIARAHLSRGTIHEGIESTRAGLALIEGRGMTEAEASLGASLASMLFDISRYAECLARSERASAQARSIGADAVLAEAEILRGVALGSTGNAPEGIVALQGAVALAHHIGDLESLTFGLLCLGTGAMLTGFMQQAQELFEQLRATARRMGDPVQIALGSSYLGITLTYMGEWEQADRELRLAAELIHPIQSRYSGYPLWQLAEHFVYRGLWEEADGCVAEAIAAAGENLLAVRLASGVAAEVAILRGQPEEAIRRLEPLRDLPGMEEQGVTAFLSILAWAYLDAGDVDRAIERADEAVERIRRQGFRLYLSDALRVQAMTRVARGEMADAARMLEEAIELGRALPMPFAEGRALVVYGEVLHKQGNMDEAVGALREALVIFRRLGAERDSDRVERALSRVSLAL